MEITRRFTMAAYLASSLLMALSVSTTPVAESKQNKNIITAMQEMQRASYFTFVTLLNMVQDEIPRNATFLIPSDRALSKTAIPENKTLEFILRHSIPSPLLSDDLLRFPTGTMVPTYQQDYMLNVVNGGRKRFHLNNVQLVSRDICTAVLPFRCHGIYGVLKEEGMKTQPTCSQATPPTKRAVGPAPAPAPAPFPAPSLAPSPPSSLPPLSSPSLVPTISPPPADSNDGSKKANSSDRLHKWLFTTLVLCMVLSITRLPF